jgi:hypothetical protein
MMVSFAITATLVRVRGSPGECEASYAIPQLNQSKIQRYRQNSAA